jgi:hypothetical protein
MVRALIPYPIPLPFALLRLEVVPFTTRKQLLYNIHEQNRGTQNILNTPHSKMEDNATL